ncbi:hypothetical protein [Hansschlegelia zhihuaiae]|uniref:Beta/gamma crystallin 'Greek key' domain-containing protein n=1 Tax=Hansschlegelia zhihuaiae TaxID=405005 RepID=A0A4Q0MAX1_9HYPH|nr:hypothetical protein [Hansschlegelia zhihuaiae]RXF69936.1 hypothetical protein EK403_17515 [Hansschlegelia zhihuaiae]
MALLTVYSTQHHIDGAEEGDQAHFDASVSDLSKESRGFLGLGAWNTSVMRIYVQSGLWYAWQDANHEGLFWPLEAGYNNNFPPGEVSSLELRRP